VRLRWNDRKRTTCLKTTLKGSQNLKNDMCRDGEGGKKGGGGIIWRTCGRWSIRVKEEGDGGGRKTQKVFWDGNALGE